MTRMKLDYEKVKQLLEDKPNITQEEYNKRFWELWEETEEYQRECFNCGDAAEPETGFLFECNLYCSDCCPEGYGADDRESIE